ncbi:hypothetical protein METBIDRAFT_79367 [Metschnikowia bicuspidata var. bicuspidata NRRL YB-4993]|uniref:RING-type domain-containing protein n=1 Tax=Metschnikowia bicuspidata var. bicuspidata NRRL YB-4993 TaxID=869754 RepID=A0A1A0H7J2_9ASCO|nr:hypothetical protein METBIDRAFT_79367 [Metschnikowia bicuspidata var. bicuspidata NRRL YB-4993]OBA20064.1 hypothetical protein METBIDRAFT_79367 [Metschnikowia bicuspidata var. bicuspidata NRRL YB-4993]
MSKAIPTLRSLSPIETALPSFLVEFDLDAILEYANAISPLGPGLMHSQKPTKTSSASSRNENANFVIMDRNWVTEMSSPVRLEPLLISQYLGGGVSLNDPETYQIHIENFDFKPSSTGGPLVIIFQRQNGLLKRGGLLSMHVLDPAVESAISSEIFFIGSRMKKCKSHFAISKMLLSIELCAATQKVALELSYKVEIVTLLYRYFSSDVSQALDNVIKPHIKVIPQEGSEFNSKFESFLKDNQLFYKVVSDKTGRMPACAQPFTHPGLQTTLLPFQRKSVLWLLSKEGVEYDEKSQKCVSAPVVTSELHHAILNYPHTDIVWLARQIHDIFSRLCFGWKRVYFHGEICWYNNYTGNIMLELQALMFLKSYYEENTSDPLPGCGLLSEEMGLGKTVEVTTLIQLNPRPLHEVGASISLQFNDGGDFLVVKKAKTTLIAAPESILRQWYTEICQICPALLVTIYKGLGKYPELNNIPQYIAEFLQNYDVVLINYSTLSRETDYANYSSRHKPTRGGKKRTSEGTEISKPDEKGQETGPQSTTAESFKAEFHIPEFRNQDEVALTQKKFERTVITELARKIAERGPKNIPHTLYYESPLMSFQWWRVVLDEVQMVSSGSTRAFATAAILPRFHSWGVSGTPSTLPAVLKFLRFLPFNYEIHKFAWHLLTSPESANEDFVEVWLTLAIRHTKNMVHDDIKLPPQQRILLIIPLTEVEQDKYKEVLESTLAYLGIYDSKTTMDKSRALDSSSYSHLRTWLLKLRQLCGNLQVGKLPRTQTLKGRNKTKILISAEKELKTLGNVLVDMIESVKDEVSECEKALVNRVLEICLAIEYVYQPDKVIEVLNVMQPEIQILIDKVRQNTETDNGRLRRVRALLIKANALSHETENISDSDENLDLIISDSKHSVMKTELDRPAEKDMDDEEIWVNLAEFRKLRDRVNAHHARLRSWKLIQHKCFFLLASAHFQLYDTEYQEKVTQLKISLDIINIVVDTIKDKSFLKKDPTQTSEIKNISCLDSDVRILKARQLHTDDREKRNKALEKRYYELAEECRREILLHAINDVQRVTKKRIRLKMSISSGDWTNDGQKTFPKTTKKLFASIPKIDVSCLNGLSSDMKCKQVVDQFEQLCIKLNLQADSINANMSQLLTVLTNPLTDNKKDADGEEFDQSVQDQEKASCLIFIVSQMLQDRANAVFESTAAILEIERHQENDFKQEAQRVTDRSFLKALLKTRHLCKPDTTISLEELVDDGRLLELEYKRSKFSFGDVTSLDLLATLRTIFENEKIAEVLLKKELNTSFNTVFNSRVEYFRQLQHISDSVQNEFSKNLEDRANAESAEALFQNLFKMMVQTQSNLAKRITRARYLATLLTGTDSDHQEQEQDDIICIICRSAITVGSLTFCGHKFCKYCLEEWLRRSPRCPMCKSPTDKSTVYGFTQYKGGLKAQHLETSHSDNFGQPSKRKAHVNQIYKQLDVETLSKVQRIYLSSSFGSKVDLIVRQVLYLRGVDPGVQIVIFSQWQDLLVILAFAFEKMNISFVSAKGSHVSTSRRQKNDPVEEFKDRANIKTCFLLNSQAQSSGLTLINATHIFLCEPLINTSTELQAISRIHRIGQKKPTTVWMFCIENTVEESIVAIGTKRRIEYLHANAKDSNGKDEHNKTQRNGKALEENELRAAESFVLTMSSASRKKNFLDTTEFVDDEDLKEIYFGSNTKQII